MRKKYNFQTEIKISFLAGVFVIASLTALIVFGAYGDRLKEQQMYALEQNYTQNYEGISNMAVRMTGLARQLSVGYAMDLWEMTRGDNAAEEIHQFYDLTEYTTSLEFAVGDVSIHYYIDDEWSVVHSSGLHYRPVSTLYGKDWYERLEERDGRPVWFVYQGDVYRSEDRRMAVARSISDSKDYMQSIGVLVISLDIKSLMSSIVQLAEGQLIYLEDENGTVVIANDNELLESMALPAEIRRKIYKTYRMYSCDSGKYLLRRSPIGDTGMYLVSVVPYQYLLNVWGQAALWILVCYGLILVFAFWYIHAMSKRLMRPLNLFTESIRKSTEEGSMNPLQLGECENEIVMLVEAYNKLIDKIGILMRQQYQMGEEKMQAELLALQSQINPHFLYNTLDMVNWMAERNEKENVQLVIEKLSGFYRLALSGGREIITIREEIELCETYLSIQRMRFRGKIQYERDIEDGILPYQIPKIVLQPFLENAILHGINASPEGRGTISLNGWMEDGHIILAVTDDGVGMPQEMKDWQQETKGSHYGMKNIQKRLSMFFKEEIPLEVDSTPGVGTCVSINIPAWKWDTDNANASDGGKEGIHNAAEEKRG